jgi:hypothetical protein
MDPSPTQPQVSPSPHFLLQPGGHGKARQLAADDYLLKPSDPLKLAELVKSLNERWLSQTARQLDTNGTEPGPKDHA